MGRKHRNPFIALWLLAGVLLTSASAQETNKSTPERSYINFTANAAVGVRASDGKLMWRAIPP